MKTLKFIVFGLALSMAPAIQSQITFGVQIGVAPAWGPAGYSDTRYYYLPDVEAYYDVQTSMFIYNDGGVWVRRGHLPERYRDYDLYGGYKVVMNDYRGESPYSHFNEHRSRYGRGYHRDGQRTIGERPHRDNHEAKIMHEEKHENKEVRHDNERRNDQGNKVGGHENEKKVSHDNGKHETHDNGNNKNEDHGKDSKDDHGHDGGRR